MNDSKADFSCTLNENNCDDSTLDSILHHLYSLNFNEAFSQFLYGDLNSYDTGNQVNKFTRSVNNEFKNGMPNKFKGGWSGELAEEFKEMSKSILDMNKELAIMTKNLTIISEELAEINVN